MNTREYWLGKKFSDPKRYPYGLNRSGDFTLAQSRLLEDHGNLITALLREEVSNPNKDDMALKKAILERNSQFSPLCQVWLKYCSINHTKISVSSSARSNGEESEDDWVDDEPLD